MIHAENRVAVHPRVGQRHPEIKDEDVVVAWENAFVIQKRIDCYPDTYAAAGADKNGRILELLATELEDDSFLIYHAMKITQKMKRELGLR